MGLVIGKNKDRMKKMIREYKEMETFFGVIQIKNNINGKVFIDVVPNIRNRWHFYKLNVNNQFYTNSDLQKDWNNYGEDSFSFEILYQKEASKVDNVRKELKVLREEWMDRLQPYEENGYNKRPKER